MARLRVYDVGKGDCIAIREGHETKFIYDTGEGGKHFKRGKERSQCAGFGLALFDAIGRIDTNSTREPPIVIISHVDDDHIGGLKDWVISVLNEANSWKEARQIAKREIKEVWCNIPLANQALAQFGGSSIQSQGESLPDQTYGEPEEDSIKHWHERFPFGDNETDTEAAIKKIRALEQYSKKVFGPFREQEDGGESAIEKSAELNPPHFDWLKTTLLKAFPSQQEFIEEVIDGGFVRKVDTTNRMEAEEKRKNGLRMDIFIDFAYSGVYFYLYSVNEANQPFSYGTRHRFEFWLGLPRDSLNFLTYIRKMEMVLDIEREEAIPVFETMNQTAGEIYRDLEACETLRQVLRYCLNMARDSASGNREAHEKITILEAFLGLTEEREVETQLDVFSTLDKLGVPIRGGNIDDIQKGLYILPDKINGLTFKLLAPGEKRLEKLFKEWNRIQKKLAIPNPPYAEAFYFTRSMDTSPTNLSSISLWLEQVGSRSSVILTGDGLYREVFDQMAKYNDTAIAENISRFCFQIPHHGGIRNTNVDEDKHPNHMLSSGKKISVAFASGGLEGVTDGKGMGPRKEIIEFYQKGADDVIATRGKIAEQNSKYYDIKLY